MTEHLDGTGSQGDYRGQGLVASLIDRSYLALPERHGVEEEVSPIEEEFRPGYPILGKPPMLTSVEVATIPARERMVAPLLPHELLDAAGAEFIPMNLNGSRLERKAGL